MAHSHMSRYGNRKLSGIFRRWYKQKINWKREWFKSLNSETFKYLLVLISQYPHRISLVIWFCFNIIFSQMSSLELPVLPQMMFSRWNSWYFLSKLFIFLNAYLQHSTVINIYSTFHFKYFLNGVSFTIISRLFIFCFKDFIRAKVPYWYLLEIGWCARHSK